MSRAIPNSSTLPDLSQPVAALEVGVGLRPHLRRELSQIGGGGRIRVEVRRRGLRAAAPALAVPAAAAPHTTTAPSVTSSVVLRLFIAVPPAELLRYA